MGTEVESPNSNNRVSQIITDSFLFLEGEEDSPVNGNASLDFIPPGELHGPAKGSPTTKCFISPNGNSDMLCQDGEAGGSLSENEEAVGISSGDINAAKAKACSSLPPMKKKNHRIAWDIEDAPSDDSSIAGLHGSAGNADLKKESGSISVSERILRLEKEGSSCKTSDSSILHDSSSIRTIKTTTKPVNDIEYDSCDSNQDTHDKKDSLQACEKKVASQREENQGQSDTSRELTSEGDQDIQGHKKVIHGKTKVSPTSCQVQGQCEKYNETYETQLQEHARFIVSKVLNCNSLREAFKRSQALRKIKRQCMLDNNGPVLGSEVARPKNLNIFDTRDETVECSYGNNPSSLHESESVEETSSQGDAAIKSSPSISSEGNFKEKIFSDKSPSTGATEKGETVPKTSVVLRRKKSSAKKSADTTHDGGSGSCDSENSSPCQSPATRRRHVLRSPVLRLKQEWNSVDMGNDLESPRQSEDSEDDDDAGIYAESYRNSQWVYLGNVSAATSTDTLDVDTDESRTSTNSASSGFETTTDTSFGDIDAIINDGDDVDSAQTTTRENFNVSVDSGLGQTEVASPRLYKQRVQYDDLPPTLPRRSKHVRSESISTTASEIEFRKRYQAKTRRIVQRKSSTQTYQRMSERFYDDERCITIEKREGDRTFGFHIKSCRPVMVSTVEWGSAAEAAGVRVGDSVIAVNDVNVLEVSHEEAIRLISQNSQKVKLTVATDNKLLSDLPLCIGYLNKQGGSGILKNWRRRWFALKQDHCLYYYKTEEDKDPLGAILLTNYTISKAPEANRKNTFKAHKYGQRTYYFQADTEDEMNSWASALSNAAKTTTKADTWLDVSSHNVGLPALSIKSPDCHGHLTKMGNRRKNWKRRYCVLKDACLYYYIDLTSSTAQGVAHLHGYCVEESLPFNKKFGFTLQPPDPSMRTFYFFADNETDMRRWINALQKSIGKWVRADD